MGKRTGLLRGPELPARQHRHRRRARGGQLPIVQDDGRRTDERRCAGRDDLRGRQVDG